LSSSEMKTPSILVHCDVKYFAVTCHMHVHLLALSAELSLPRSRQLCHTAVDTKKTWDY
jgi:hypothetical protein